MGEAGAEAVAGPVSGPSGPRPVATEAWTRSGRFAGVFRLVLLLFVVYPAITLVAIRPDALQVLLVIAADALFAGLVLAGARWSSDDPRRSGLIVIAANLGLTAIAAILSVRDPRTGWFAMFYYASTSAAVVTPSSRAMRLMIAAGAIGAATMAVTVRDPAAALVQGVSITVVGLVLLTAFEVRRTNAELVAARDELASLAVAEERNRIARDLHDTLGHSLSVIAIKSELAGRLLASDPERARREIADVENVARDALAAVRETVSGYRRPSLAQELAGARAAFAAAGIEARVEPAPEGIPPEVDTVLAWAVREGVTNVVRHSGARRAEVRAERLAAEATVEVVDDGQGAGGAAPGSGIAGLRDRVALLGGAVETGATSDGGFLLRVRVPIASAS